MPRTPFFFMCLLFGVGAIWLALFTPQPLRLQAYLDYSVIWAQLTLAGLAVIGSWCAWQTLRAQPLRRRSLGFDALATLLLTIVICTLVPSRSFIEHDENSVIATAQAIHFLGAPTSAYSGYVDSTGTLTPLDLGLNKRGVMYPLMLNLVAPHAVSFTQAPYVINAAAGWLLLFLLLRIVRRFLPGPGALAAPVLLACFPVFTVTMRGGTFDVVNSALLLMLLHLAASLINQHSTSRLLLFAATAAVLSQIRLESVLVVTVMTMILVVVAWVRQSPRWRHAVLALIALLISPALLRMAVPIDYEMPAPWFQPWTVRNMPDNIERIGAWLWTPAGMETGNPLIGLLVLLVMIVQLARRHIKPAHARLTLLMLGPAAALTTLLMYSYWGQISQLVTARYFIYLAAVVAGGGTLALHLLLRPLAGNRAGYLCIGLAATLFCVDIQRSVAADRFSQLSLHRYRDALRLAIHDAYGNCNVLIVTVASPLLVTRGIGAILPADLPTITDQGPEFLERNGITAIALGVQAEPDAPTPETVLGPVRAHTRVSQRAIGDILARVYQIWPPAGVSVTRCESDIREILGMQLPTTPTPRRTWEHFVERWSEHDPALKMLMEPSPTEQTQTTAPAQ